MRRLETRIPPPVLVLVIAIVMVGAGMAGGGGGATGIARLAVAAVLFVVGLTLLGPAARSFRQAGTTINPMAPDRASQLVTSGAFRVTRNPMYLGMALVLSALAVWLGGLIVWLGPVAFVAYITRFQIIPEERAMAAKFGAQYEAYRGRVRRWV